MKFKTEAIKHYLTQNHILLMQACLKVLPFVASTLCGLRLIVSSLAPLAALRPEGVPFKARWARLCTWVYVGVHERRGWVAEKESERACVHE